MTMINSNNGSVSVGTSLVLISESKTVSQRVRLILTNTSTGGQTISLAMDGQAVAGAGLVLSPGGSMGWEVQSNIPVPQGRVTAIGSGAGGTLAIYEEVLQ